jgi:hypothetical protein
MLLQANGRSSDEHKAHSEHLQPWQAAAKRGIDGPFGETEENGCDAVAAVFESAVADSLKSVDNEPETMASLKYEVCLVWWISLMCVWCLEEPGFVIL